MVTRVRPVPWLRSWPPTRAVQPRPRLRSTHRESVRASRSSSTGSRLLVLRRDEPARALAPGPPNRIAVVAKIELPVFGEFRQRLFNLLRHGIDLGGFSLLHHPFPERFFSQFVADVPAQSAELSQLPLGERAFVNGHPCRPPGFDATARARILDEVKSAPIPLPEEEQLAQGFANAGGRRAGALDLDHG